TSRWVFAPVWVLLVRRRSRRQKGLAASLSPAPLARRNYGRTRSANRSPWQLRLDRPVHLRVSDRFVAARSPVVLGAPSRGPCSPRPECWRVACSPIRSSGRRRRRPFPGRGRTSGTRWSSHHPIGRFRFGNLETQLWSYVLLGCRVVSEICFQLAQQSL